MRILLGAMLAVALSASAEQIRLLSAGAVGTGVTAAVAAFEKESGHTVKAIFNTAPQVAARLEAGEPYDVVIAPPAAMQRFAAAGKVAAEQVPIGKVGMSVAIRGDAPVRISPTSPPSRTRCSRPIRSSSNRASSGQYFEDWLKREGIYGRLEAKITRYADAGAVMEHTLKGKGREMAVGPTTEIVDYRGKGLKLVGALPAAIQNYTSYVASPGPDASDAARALLKYLASPAAKSAFNAAGIE
jgi:molybdate transport system substrate-binding protein